ncbi:unnamed protein product [Ixodes persulcatus]
MKRLRERVCQRQQSSKKYTDQRRGAKRPTFVIGQFVRYRLPKKTRYDKSKFSEPLKIVERVGRWTFRLEDGRAWNASKLTTAVPPEKQSTPSKTFQHRPSGSLTVHWVPESPPVADDSPVPAHCTPSGVVARDPPVQPNGNQDTSGRRSTGNRTVQWNEGAVAASNTAATASTNETVRRSRRERQKPVRFGDAV